MVNNDHSSPGSSDDTPLDIDFLNDLTVQLKRIRVAIRYSLSRFDFDQTDLKDIINCLNSCSGAASAFGYVDIGDYASCIIYQLENLQIHGPSARDRKSIEELVENLERAATKALLDGPKSSTPKFEQKLSDQDTPSVAVIDNSHYFRNVLTLKLQASGYRVRTYNNIDAFTHDECVVPPVALVVDPSTPSGKNQPNASSIESTLSSRGWDTALVYVSKNDDFVSRLAAVRQGCDHYLVKPINFSRLMEVLGDLTLCNIHNPLRILILDDSPDLVMYYAKILNRVGIETRCIISPLDISEVLIEFQPDAVVLDMHMPDCTGMEIARVLRQDAAYAFLPIIFLSGEMNKKLQMEARAIGADDFLTKPAMPEDFASIVVSRAQRYRSLKESLSRDGMTGLPTSKTFHHELMRLISLGNRSEVQLHLCLLDIDDFKRINDTHGHLAGDAVIKRLSTLLADSVRCSDLVGRLGGDEFGVALVNTTTESAISIVNRIVQGFYEIPHSSRQGNFHATISVGISTALISDDVTSLMERADQSLYGAKRLGKNGFQSWEASSLHSVEK